MAKRLGGLFLVSRLQEELDRAFARAGEVVDDDRRADLAPPMDVIESQSGLIVILEVPGLTAEELAIETSGSRLVIRGRRRPETHASGPVRFYCMERGRGEFQRTVELIGAFDTHRASARLAGGLLRVEVPKISDRRLEPRRIAIESEDRS